MGRQAGSMNTRWLAVGLFSLCMRSPEATDRQREGPSPPPSLSSSTSLAAAPILMREVEELWDKGDKLCKMHACLPSCYQLSHPSACLFFALAVSRTSDNLVVLGPIGYRDKEACTSDVRKIVGFSDSLINTARLLLGQPALPPPQCRRHVYMPPRAIPFA